MEFQIANLKIGYAKQLVLPPISLTISSPGLYLITGGNGVGKTTFFKSLIGFLPISSGEILLGGNPIDPEKEAYKYFAAFFNPGAYYKALTLNENVKLMKILHGEKFSIGERLKVLGIECMLNKKVATLSLGQKTKFGLSL